MFNCYRCSTPLEGDKISDEHLFTQALGGRLHSEELLCRPCNSAWGEHPDGDLFKAMQSLAVRLNVRRAKGRGDHPKVPGIASDGTKIKMDSHGKPEPHDFEFKQHDLSGGAKQISMVARNEAEALRNLKKLQAKYPQLDIEQILKDAKSSQPEIHGPSRVPRRHSSHQ